MTKQASDSLKIFFEQRISVSINEDVNRDLYTKPKDIAPTKPNKIPKVDITFIASRTPIR